MNILKPNTRAFTVLELMVVVAVIVVLAGLVLPALFGRRHGNGHGRIQCLNNLKQVGLALRTWEQDNGNYPMRFRTNNFDGPSFGNGKQMYLYFHALSNELTNPKLLFCPVDGKRRPAANFDGDFNSSRISYFLALDATPDSETNLLAGDRNISVKGASARNGVLEITTNQVSSSNNLTVGWTKELHNECGNVLFADSHVEQLTSVKLRDALRTSGLATNRLVLP